jgi:hypothetical protein
MGRRRKPYLTLDSILTTLKGERDRLRRAIAILEGTAPRRGRPRKVQTAAVRPKRHMSAAARRRMSETMRQWWARKKKG